MQKGYLIYEDWEAQKNKAFIDMFVREGQKMDMSFSYISKAEYQICEIPDFVLNRTRDPSVSKWYASKGVPVFHSECVTEIGNHKMKTIEYLKEHLSMDVLRQKWAPQSFYCSKEKMKEIVNCIHRNSYEMLESITLFQKKGIEIVIKSVNGHGGSQVALLPVKVSPNMDLVEMLSASDKKESMVSCLERFCEFDCIFQERIPSDSKDVRVYLLGNEIYQAVLRQGKDDFRSNFSLGGNVSAYTLSKEERVWVEKFLDALREERLGMAGMDFIIDKDGRLLFNELEEMVGCRMLYQTTKLDIVKDYVAWLKRFV